MESYSTQTTTPGSSSSTDDRQSQALRASVLDVALQLGFGTSSGIDRWLDGGDSADDPGTMSSPTLTYDKSATSASEESWTPDSQHAVPNFSHTNKSQWSPYTPRTPYTDFSLASNTLAVETHHHHTDESQLRSFSRQAGDITLVDPDTLPRPDKAPKKLKKKRGDGFESEGYVSDSAGFVKRKDKDATGEVDKKKSEELEKKRLKEEKKDAKVRAKEEKKRAKKDKDAPGPSTFPAGGYETDNASYGYLSSNEPVKKSKPKKKSKGDGDKARDATTDVEDGYQSAPAAVKKRPTFLKLRSGKSKSDLQKEAAAAAPRSPSPPPVPAIRPLPIASRFATTLDGGGSRSETPMGSIASSSMDTASVSTAMPPPPMDASSASGSVASHEANRVNSRNNNTVRFMGELVSADSITAEDFALFARAASPPPNLARPSGSSSSTIASRAQSPPVLRIPPAAVQQASPIYQTSNSAGAGPSRSASALSGINGSGQTRSARAMSPYSSSPRDPLPPSSPARALSPAAISLPRSRGPSPLPTGLVAPETFHGGRSPSPNPHLLHTSSPSPRPSSPGQLRQLIVPSYDYVVPSPTPSSTVSSRFGDMPPPSPAPGSPLPRTPRSGQDDDESGSTSARTSAVYGRPVSPFGAGPRGRASPFPTRPVAQVPRSKSPNNGPPPPRASSRQGARSPAPSSIARYHQLGQPRGQSDDFDSQPMRQRANHSVSPSITATSEQGHSLMKKPSGRRRSDSDVALNRFTATSAAPPINIEQPSDGEEGDDGADFESLFDRYAYDEKSAYGGMEDDEDELDNRARPNEPAVRARGSLDLAENIRRLSAMPPPSQSQSPFQTSPTPSASSPTPVYPAPGSTTPVSTLSRKNTLTRAKPPPQHVPTDSILLDGDDDDDDDKSIYPDDGRRTMYEEEHSPPRRPSVDKGTEDAAEMPRASFIDRDKSQRLRRALVDRVEMQYAYEKLGAKESSSGEFNAPSKSGPLPSTVAVVEPPTKRQPSSRSQPSPTPSGLSARAVRSPPPRQKTPVSSRARVQEAVKPGWF